MKKTGIINKIIAFSNVDGPGNRTAVFFQGCNLTCLYCHNPETINICRGCGECVRACPVGALEGRYPETFSCHPERSEGSHISEAVAGEGAYLPSPGTSSTTGFAGGPPSPEGKVKGRGCPEGAGEGDLLQPTWHPSRCLSCDACLKACPHLSSPKTRLMTAEELAQQIKKTAPYINGVTFSGGECTLQRDFLLEVIPLIRELGLGVLLDSNGTYDFEKDPELLDIIDGVMLDIKAADSDFCLYLTGAGPELPLKNLAFLQAAGKLTEVRTVLLPEGPNEGTISTVAPLLSPTIPYKLLRYRPFGVRQEGIDAMGNTITDESAAEILATLARSLGATACRVV